MKFWREKQLLLFWRAGWKKPLQSAETGLVGKWIFKDGKASTDDTCKRIEWLTTRKLKEIGISKDFGGWETLFQDPVDGRNWMKTYPQSELHGGGPPALINISQDVAAQKFELSEPS